MSMPYGTGVFCEDDPLVFFTPEKRRRASLIAGQVLQSVGQGSTLTRRRRSRAEKLAVLATPSTGERLLTAIDGYMRRKLSSSRVGVSGYFNMGTRPYEPDLKVGVPEASPSTREISQVACVMPIAQSVAQTPGLTRLNLSVSYKVDDFPLEIYVNPGKENFEERPCRRNYNKVRTSVVVEASAKGASFSFSQETLSQGFSPRASQEQAMKMKACDYAAAWGMEVENKKYNWGHLQAHSAGGKEVESNLVLVSEGGNMRQHFVEMLLNRHLPKFVNTYFGNEAKIVCEVIPKIHAEHVATHATYHICCDDRFAFNVEVPLLGDKPYKQEYFILLRAMAKKINHPAFYELVDGCIERFNGRVEKAMETDSEDSLLSGPIEGDLSKAFEACSPKPSEGNGSDTSETDMDPVIDEAAPRGRQKRAHPDSELLSPPRAQRKALGARVLLDRVAEESVDESVLSPPPAKRRRCNGAFAFCQNGSAHPARLVPMSPELF